MSKAKNLRITTPFGRLKFGSLSTPSAKFDPKKPQYEAVVVFDSTDPKVVEMVKTINKAAEEAQKLFSATKPAVKKFTLHPEFSPETDKESGEVVPDTIMVRAKRLASGVTKDGKPWSVNIGRFDMAGVVIPPDNEIGWGSTVSLSLELVPFEMPATKSVGVTLRLLGVQVQDLVSRDTGSAKSLGFATAAPKTTETLDGADEAAEGEDDGSGFN
jgi:hypothetical protein